MKENKRLTIYESEINAILFNLYTLETKMSGWNSDRRELRVSNRTDAYDLLSEAICMLQSKL